MLAVICRPAPVSAQAQPDQTSAVWNFAGWYGGGCYPDLEFDPNVKNRVYLVSDVAGIWKSDDLGEQWTAINKGLGHLVVADIAVAPSDSGILYAATKGGVFVSRDAGENWEAAAVSGKEITFFRPASSRVMAVSSEDPGVLYIGTTTGAVYVSRNFGADWKRLGGKEKPFGDGKPITALALEEKSGFLYAASHTGIMRFAFGGETWDKVRKTDKPVSDLFVPSKLPIRLYAVSGGSLMLSVDDGDQWKEFEASSRGAMKRVDFFQGEKSSLLAGIWEKGWNGGIVLSRDEGVWWTEPKGGMKADIVLNPTRSWARNGGRVASVKINPFDEKVLFRTDWWGVWRSDDGGASWNEKIKGAPNVVGTDLAVGSKGFVLAASMDNGLLRSTNGGGRYEAVFPSKGYQKSVNGHVWRVVLLPDGETVIATGSPWEDRLNQVMISRDKGKTYEIVRKGLPSARPKGNTMWGEGYPRGLAYAKSNPDRVYLGMDGDDTGGLYVSQDRGKSWVRSKGQPGSLRIYNGLAVDPQNPMKVYWGACGKGGGVYLSEDGGETWDKVFSEMTWVFDLAVGADGAIYAGGDNNGPSLYVSRNGGKKWQRVFRHSGKGVVEAIAPHPEIKGQVAFSTVQWGGVSGGRFFISDKHGEESRDITADLPEGTGANAMAFSPEGKELYMTRYAGSVYKRQVN